MTDDKMRELFREMRGEPVPPDSLVRVRAAVRGRTERRFWAGWWLLAEILGVVALVALVWQDRRSAPAVRPEVASVRQLPVAPPPVAALPAKGRPEVRQQPRLAAPPRRESVTIRIDTPDPDVVIFLIGD